jgi:hypothetical protein
MAGRGRGEEAMGREGEGKRRENRAPQILKRRYSYECTCTCACVRSQGRSQTSKTEEAKGVWGFGGRKSPSGVQGRSPGRGYGGLRPPEAEAF